MQALIGIVRECVSLFIDDGSLVAIVLIWIAICGVALPALVPSPSWHGPILFIGLALVLVENALRSARRGFNPG